MLLGPGGEIRQTVSFGGKSHADFVSAADVCPDTAGMEVVLLEEELRSGKMTWNYYSP